MEKVALLSDIHWNRPYESHHGSRSETTRMGNSYADGLSKLPELVDRIIFAGDTFDEPSLNQIYAHNNIQLKELQFQEKQIRGQLQELEGTPGKNRDKKELTDQLKALETQREQLIDTPEKLIKNVLKRWEKEGSTAIIRELWEKSGKIISTQPAQTSLILPSPTRDKPKTPVHAEKLPDKKESKRKAKPEKAWTTQVRSKGEPMNSILANRYDPIALMEAIIRINPMCHIHYITGNHDGKYANNLLCPEQPDGDDTYKSANKIDDTATKFAALISSPDTSEKFEQLRDLAKSLVDTLIADALHELAVKYSNFSVSDHVEMGNMMVQHGHHLLEDFGYNKRDGMTYTLATRESRELKKMEQQLRTMKFSANTHTDDPDEDLFAQPITEAQTAQGNKNAQANTTQELLERMCEVPDINEFIARQCGDGLDEHTRGKSKIYVFFGHTHNKFNEVIHPQVFEGAEVHISNLGCLLPHRTDNFKLVTLGEGGFVEKVERLELHKIAKAKQQVEKS